MAFFNVTYPYGKNKQAKLTLLDTPSFRVDICNLSATRAPNTSGEDPADGESYPIVHWPHSKGKMKIWHIGFCGQVLS